jgi:hypothetical protein
VDATRNVDGAVQHREWRVRGVLLGESRRCLQPEPGGPALASEGRRQEVRNRTQPGSDASLPAALRRLTFRLRHFDHEIALAASLNLAHMVRCID